MERGLGEYPRIEPSLGTFPDAFCVDGDVASFASLGAERRVGLAARSRGAIARLCRSPPAGGRGWGRERSLTETIARGLAPPQSLPCRERGFHGGSSVSCRRKATPNEKGDASFRKRPLLFHRNRISDRDRVDLRPHRHPSPPCRRPASRCRALRRSAGSARSWRGIRPCACAPSRHCRRGGA